MSGDPREPDRIEVPLPNGASATIRKAVPEDAADLIKYLNAVGGETDYLSFGAGEFTLSEADEAAYIRSLEDPAHGIMLVATVDGVVVGMASTARPSRPRFRHGAELALSVRRAYWGSGLGRR